MLPRCAGLLTGYLGKAEIGEAALRALERIRAANGEAAYACDPVIGDVGPGIYVAAGVGEFFRDRALAARDHRHAERLRARMADRRTVERSASRAAGDRRACVLGDRGSSWRRRSSSTIRLPALSTFWPGTKTGFWRVRTPNLPISVNGSGDLFAALFFHHWLETRDTREALSRATSSVHAIVKATHGRGSRELSLIAAQDELIQPVATFPRQRRFDYRRTAHLLFLHIGA